jgi:hypothetical protein
VRYLLICWARSIVGPLAGNLRGVMARYPGQHRSLPRAILITSIYFSPIRTQPSM